MLSATALPSLSWEHRPFLNLSRAHGWYFHVWNLCPWLRASSTNKTWRCSSLDLTNENSRDQETDMIWSLNPYDGWFHIGIVGIISVYFKSSPFKGKQVELNRPSMPHRMQLDWLWQGLGVGLASNRCFILDLWFPESGGSATLFVWMLPLLPVVTYISSAFQRRLIARTLTGKFASSRKIQITV